MALDTRYRPRRFEDVLGQESTVTVLRQFVRSGSGFHQSYLFCGGHGSGKCVTGDTLVHSGLGLQKIVDMVGPNEVDPVDIPVVQEVGTARAAFTYRGGRRRTIRVRTHMGYEVEGTFNHRIKVLDVSGRIVWRCLADVVEGDVACIVRRGLFGTGADLSGFHYEERCPPGQGYQTIPFDAPTTLTPAWGRLMGYLIGDGRCNSSDIEVSNSEEDVKEDVLRLLTDLCGYGRGTPDRRSASGLENLRCGRNRPRAFLDHAGLGRWGSAEKEVPWSVLCSPEPVVREFLRGYLEADGTVGPTGIEVTTKSRELARQVHVLLLQFGVVSRLSSKWVPGYGEYRRIVVDGASYTAFAARVGFVSRRKSAALSALVSAAHAEKSRLTNRYEVVPHQHERVKEAYARLPRARRGGGVSKSLFRCKNGHSNCTAEKVTRIAEAYPDADVDGHFNSLRLAGYFYDPVVSLSEGEAEVFDLNVPDGEMFAANGFMNHNTTLGRILARALLCEHPEDGNPCDACTSCRSILDRGSSECFVEVDAATNSSKDDVKDITELLQYDTFSGRRRIYLFDEAHRLSRDALDALLKPMEDTAGSSDDKLLVCIFCTTEPEKMRATIRSRCAPAFVIRRVTPEQIAGRLAKVCEAEGISYEHDALVIIAETSESHIRDALKALEGVSQLGAVTLDNVRSYLRLNANASYLAVIASLGRDLPRTLKHAHDLQEVVSPGTAYEQLAELAMLAYRTLLGVGKPPSYWNVAHIQKLGELHGGFLLRVGQLLASKPGHPTYSMLDCDLAMLHAERRGETTATAARQASPVMVVAAPAASSQKPVTETADPGRVQTLPSAPTGPTIPSPSPGMPTTRAGVYIDPRAVKRRDAVERRQPLDGHLPPLGTDEFRAGLRRIVAELALDARGIRPA